MIGLLARILRYPNTGAPTFHNDPKWYTRSLKPSGSQSMVSRDSWVVFFGDVVIGDFNQCYAKLKIPTVRERDRNSKPAN